MLTEAVGQVGPGQRGRPRIRVLTEAVGQVGPGQRGRPQIHVPAEAVGQPASREGQPVHPPGPGEPADQPDLPPTGPVGEEAEIADIRQRRILVRRGNRHREPADVQRQALPVRAENDTVEEGQVVRRRPACPGSAAAASQRAACSPGATCQSASSGGSNHPAPAADTACRARPWLSRAAAEACALTARSPARARA